MWMSKLAASFRWRSFLAYAGAFFLAGLGWLLFKHLQLQHLTGLTLLARVLHRQVEDFSPWEVLGLYGADIAWGLLLIPLLAGVMAAQRQLPGLRPVLAALLLAYVMLLHADMAAFANVSTLLNWDMIAEALAWARDDPDIIQYYVTPRTWLKILASTAGLMLLLLWLDSGCWRWPPRLRRRSAAWAATSMAIGLSMAVLLAFLQPVTAYPQSSAALARALSAMLPDPQMHQYRGHSQAQLQEAFCAMVDAPCTEQAPEAAGARPPQPALPAVHPQADSTARSPHPAPSPAPADAPAAAPAAARDVILFIMETAPAEFFDLQALMAEDPLLRSWSRQAWLARHHYASYPYTSDATFSVLSALYPEGRRQWLKCRESQALGWVDELRRAGYATRHYAPSPDSFESDGLMLERLGLSTRYIAANDAGSQARAQERLARIQRRIFAGSVAPLPAKAILDQQALERLLQDMKAWRGQGRPYVAVFAPQIGHGPWPDLLARAGPASLAERAQALGRLQMAWLHEIVAQLQQAGRLQQTLLLVTGDHGLRTQAEYEGIPAGWLAGVSSRVPLLIYDGGRELPFDAGRVSSHIDIGPTVMRRLGRLSPQAYAEGLPLDAEGLARRKTFMQGVGYLGAELMHQQGQFLAHAPLRKACMSARRDDLGDGEVQPYARCQAVFEPLKALHLEAMRRLCIR